MPGMEVRPCADQESFVRGDPTLDNVAFCLFVCFSWCGVKTKVVIIAPPAKRPLNEIFYHSYTGLDKQFFSIKLLIFS